MGLFIGKYLYFSPKKSSVSGCGIELAPSGDAATKKMLHLLYRAAWVGKFKGRAASKKLFQSSAKKRFPMYEEATMPLSPVRFEEQRMLPGSSIWN